MSYNVDFRGNLAFEKKINKKIRTAVEEFDSNWIIEDDDLVWNGSDDSEEFLSKLSYILERIIAPNNNKVDGLIKWRGEDMGDSGEIEVKDNVLTFRGGHI